MRTLSALLVLALPTAALAAPGTVAHQGRLHDALGAPLAGSHDLSLTLWDDPAGGAQLHTETITTDFSEGFYAVTLGTGGGLDTTTFEGDAVWLELAVDSGPALAGRIQLHTVPWAFNADTATNVSGGIVDATEIRIDGTTVVNAAGGTLGSLSCSAGEVPSFDGSAWGCASLAHTHDAAHIDNGVLAIARIPIGTGVDTVAAGDHTHPAADWSTITGKPSGLDDGDDDTTYTVGAGLTLDTSSNNQLDVVDNFVNTDGDAMNAEYPTLTIQHPTAGGVSGIRFQSRVNAGSDGGFILFQDETSESPGTSTEDVRLTIGVHNDFRQSAAHSDELWLQGGGRLVSNVGTYDAELDGIIGVTTGSSAAVSHEWRANNVVAMTLDSSGVLDPVGGLACPAGMFAVAGGRLCVDEVLSGPTDAISAVGDCATRQARVCTHTDMHQACGVQNPFGGNAAGWYGDHGQASGGNTDDEYLTWNSTSCAGNNDGAPQHYNGSSRVYKCCW